MAWKIGKLSAGLVLDLPLIQKYHNVGADTFTDRTPWGNSGANNGADVDVDHSTFVAANSDYVRIPNSVSLSPTNAMTVMCWVKGAAQNNKYFISHLDLGVSQIAFGLASSTSSFYNKLKVFISDDGTANTGHKKFYNSSIIVFNNSWHLLGFTFDAGTLKLFIDDAEDTNPTKAFDDAITTIHNSTADIMVGCYLNLDTPAGLINGDIARPRIWNRALTAAEWALAFDQEKGLYL